MFVARRNGNCLYLIPDAWRTKYLSEGWSTSVAVGYLEVDTPTPLESAQRVPDSAPSVLASPSTGDATSESTPTVLGSPTLSTAAPVQSAPDAPAAPAAPSKRRTARGA